MPVYQPHMIAGNHPYCWWLKSCTTKDDDYLIIYRVLTIPGGCLGFLPSPRNHRAPGLSRLRWNPGHALGLFVQDATAAVRLLFSALCASDESTHRPHSWGQCHATRWNTTGNLKSDGGQPTPGSWVQQRWEGVLYEKCSEIWAFRIHFQLPSPVECTCYMTTCDFGRMMSIARV